MLSKKILELLGKKCVCPDCGYEAEAPFGIPCTEVKCPKCGAQMRGPRCSK